MRLSFLLGRCRTRPDRGGQGLRARPPFSPHPPGLHGRVLPLCDRARARSPLVSPLPAKCGEKKDMSL
ncbi:hypothetical protein NL676_028212 [Syzygium grande]|nr:hypothetical protein NL676_028212 [Syzygium grande]